MGVVRDGGGDSLAAYLASMPDNQAAALITIGSLEQRTSCLERALDTGFPSKHAEGQKTGHSGHTKQTSS